MYDETPFTNAQNAINEACAWLGEMMLAEGHPNRECASNEDSWEQAQAMLSRAISFLDENGRQDVENGGQEVAGYGWMPTFKVVVTEPDAAGAADALRALSDPFIRLEAGSVVPLLTQDLVDRVKGLLAADYADRLDGERQMIDQQPEPESA